jgi:hypothetical protein
VHDHVAVVRHPPARGRRDHLAAHPLDLRYPALAQLRGCPAPPPHRPGRRLVHRGAPAAERLGAEVPPGPEAQRSAASISRRHTGCRVDLLRAGEALSALLLLATAEGLATAPLSEAAEVSWPPADAITIEH